VTAVVADPARADTASMATAVRFEMCIESLLLEVERSRPSAKIP
jgi:hypothetical protein